MLATLADCLRIVVEATAIAVLIAKAGRWESIADIRERLAALEAEREPEPTPDPEDTPPCSPPPAPSHP